MLVLVVYAGLIGLTGWQFERAPTGFIPEQDQGYLITVIQLPPGSSLARTDAVVREATKIAARYARASPTPCRFAGFDGATFTNAPNAGAIFSPLQPFEERAAKGLDRGQHPGRSAPAAGARSRRPSSSSIQPPPVRGIGTGGGFKMMVQDQRGRGLQALEAATQELVAARQPGRRA